MSSSQTLVDFKKLVNALSAVGLLSKQIILVENPLLNFFP